ncbi:MAG: DNA-directed RNA polymerase subunit beta [bacterium]
MEIKKKYFSRYKKPMMQLPDLVEMQKTSFKWIVEKGLAEIFKEFSPIRDYTGKKFELEFTGYELGTPKINEHEAKLNRATLNANLKVKVKLKNKILNYEKEQEIFLTDFPAMTPHGTFIINGVERIIVPQLARSYGVFFTEEENKGKKYFGAKIIPARGAWIEIETEADDVIYVRIDRRRKFPVSSLLRILGEGKTDAEIVGIFEKMASMEEVVSGEKTGDEITYIKNSFAKDTAKTVDESYVEIYKRLRDSDIATVASAKEFLTDVFSPEKYDLSLVGRFRFNKRFGIPTEEGDLMVKTLSFEDIVKAVQHVIELNNTPGAREDDIDHLGLRRVRCIGEMLQLKMRVGMSQMKRNIQDRMSTIDNETILPIQLVNPRPLQARIKEFYTTNQLSQFMGQENILSELEHLRKLSAFGQGGLTRERAGFEVRDVHSSHYGRVCPIQTPEGPNIGLILELSSYAKVNDLGVIETPYIKVENGRITDKITYMNALEEETHNIAHAAVAYDENGNFIEQNIEVRTNSNPGIIQKDKVDYIDVAPNQAYSIATSMIPFLEHDDANRALMGSNMQKQATPCVITEAPLVGTGIEEEAAKSTGRLIFAEDDGEIYSVDARNIVVKTNAGEKKEYPLVNFSRTNNFTVSHQRPVVNLGQKVKAGDLLADTSTSDRGQIAIGQNALIAFMSWGGSNYEDAIILSERLVKNSKFTSIHMEQFEVAVRDTKLGPEITTHDIPNVGEGKLKNLDEDGIIKVGSEIHPNDILVGKITPKGETELTPEERLLRSIFGEKSRDVKDTSLRMEHGKRGRIVSVKVFSRERGDKLESGIIKRICIEVAQLRNISVGDKLSGRHGNKGIVARILPIEDMPYMEDGTPVDVILTPLGVPSRMNLGQILELHLGLAANALKYQAISPPFLGVTEEEIREELVKAGFPETGKVKLFDGQTGVQFDQDVAIGYMYMLKLHHMVEDKIHMRSVGPYSLITQQPLGGRAQGGGQRFGEMEVWALEGYGASHILREMLTIKSDDIVGRSSTFDSIVKGEKIKAPNIPASFSVLVNELKGLALDVELKNI